MNDPIKDFVERHREEFDHLDAPVLKLDQLKARMQGAPKPQKRTILLFNRNNWLVAASILVALTCGLFFFYSNYQDKPMVQLAEKKTKDTADKAFVPAPEKNTTPETDNELLQVAARTKSSAALHEDQRKRIANPSAINTQEINATSMDLYAKLKDSTSASSRLLAILEIEKADQIDNQVLAMLTTTLNQDGNTNVRLAALNLLEKFSANGHVSASLVNSLDKQNDPIVQLGLLNLLGKMKNIEIDDKLELLAYSPNTFAAVRDEAYNILLNQNKL
jgi:hypothetical protein